MKIAELQPNQGNVDVEVEVTSVEEPRTFNKYGRDLRVANATIKDDSGEMKLTIWNDDIEKIKQGQKIKITNGYVKEFNNEKQLTTGKFGSFEVLGEGTGGETTETTAEEKPEEQPTEEEPTEEEEESLL